MTAVPRDDEWDDADDYPQTHLDDEAYDEFLGREFDRHGRLKEGPSVGFWLTVLIVVLLLAAGLIFA